MKRINPKTNQPFTHGDIREDGFLFYCYVKARTKKDGFFIENENGAIINGVFGSKPNTNLILEWNFSQER